MKLSFVLAACIALGLASAAQAQQYSYNYGGSRVLIQSQTGLVNPSSTYIGPGTLSKTAQGLPVGGIANPGLPRVNHGANIGTPGDNMYHGQPITPQRAQGLPQTHLGANIGSPGDDMRSDLHPYVQQQQRQQQQRRQSQMVNQGSLNYIYQPKQNGAAIYAPQSGTQIHY